MRLPRPCQKAREELADTDCRCIGCRRRFGSPGGTRGFSKRILSGDLRGRLVVAVDEAQRQRRPCRAAQGICRSGGLRQQDFRRDMQAITLEGAFDHAPDRAVFAAREVEV
ncbi:hypothetical protein CDEF62S_00273 [Castellaniella defragrans]